MSESHFTETTNQMSELGDKLIQEVVCAGIDFRFWHDQFTQLCEKESKSSHLKPADRKKLLAEQSQASIELKKSREDLFRKLDIMEAQIRASRITGQAGEEHSPSGD